MLTDFTDVFVCLRGGYYRNATIEEAAVLLCDVTGAHAEQTATVQETTDLLTPEHELTSQAQ